MSCVNPENPDRMPHCGDDYGHGYDHGKDKAHFEVRNLDPGSHADDCMCEPCRTVTKVLEKRGFFRTPFCHREGCDRYIRSDEAIVRITYPREPRHRIQPVAEFHASCYAEQLAIGDSIWVVTGVGVRR